MDQSSNTNPQPSDFDYTEEQIAAMIDDRLDYWGFVGEQCARCRRTANVLAGHTWKCVCGMYNALYPAFEAGPTLHENPDLGPSAETIRNGTQKSKKWAEWQELHR
jgi:hypothetical protein